MPTEKKTETTDKSAIDEIRRPFVQQLEVLKERKENLIPTPPVGTSVQWFRGGDMKESRAIAGVVTKHVRPGVVGVACFPPRTHIVHQDNVMFHKHPQAQNPGDRNVQRNGVWDYVRKNPPAKSDYYLHESEIDEQIRRVEIEMEHKVNEYLDRQRVKQAEMAR